MAENKELLLFSGGFDSVILLNELVSKGTKPTLLYFDFKQTNLEQELKHVQYWVDKYSLDVKVIDLDLNWTTSSLLEGVSKDVQADNNSQYVEMRNLIFLSYALSFAESKGMLDIYLAIVDGNYSDGDARFVKMFDSLSFNTTGIQTIAPYSLLGKDALKDYANNNLQLDMGEVLRNSVSCNYYDTKPCGVCGDCESILRYGKEFM